MSLWTCVACGFDNGPTHCCEPHSGCEDHVCTCNCWECNPQHCEECDTPLWDDPHPLAAVPARPQER